MSAKPLRTLNRPDGITAIYRCAFCGQEASVTVDEEAWRLWDLGQGPMIQDVMGGLSPGERETLISGSHEECFDAAFGEED